MNNKLKIAVVCFTGNSGLTDYSVSLCRELAKICDINFITADSYDAEKYRAGFPAIKLFRRTRHYPVDIFRFAFYLLRQRPDVVLFESWVKFPMLEWVLVSVFRAVGIRTALTIHDLLPHDQKPWSKLVLAWYYRNFDRLIVHSQRSVDGLIAMGVKTIPLLVPHGVYDIFNFDQLSRENVLPLFPDIKQDDFVVLFFGHIETRKGILEYLAASKLLENKPAFKFVVAGGNSLYGKAADKFNTYRPASNVVINDQSIPMDQVQHYFTLAHAVIVPYLEGTTSGVVKLAMAFDKPIIATDVGDFSETLNDWSGLLIQSDDITQNLAVAIKKMHNEYSSFMVALNKNKSKYQWEQIAHHHLNYLSTDCGLLSELASAPSDTAKN
ncbi:MAG: glycosyltransferase family 4 protein [Smithella sp.]|nr:glycosyltransferase family 4 protein [Patescibacteria group bacterium]MDD5524725.1 glycosyltransferase family 4 protein [Smithella sp.]